MIQEESSKKETELTGTTGTENIDPARARLRKQYFGKQRRGSLTLAILDKSQNIA